MVQDREIGLNREFELGIGEQAVYRPENVRITFLAVLEDSRCPEGVDCFWEGNGKIRLGMRKSDGKIRIFELNTNIDPQTMRVENYDIELINLVPIPTSNKEIRNENYKVALQINEDQSPFFHGVPIRALD